MYGRHLSEFKTAVEYYDRVLCSRARQRLGEGCRRRYLRYIDE